MMPGRVLLWGKGTDDAEWTYVTNYIMGTVGLVTGLLLLRLSQVYVHTDCSLFFRFRFKTHTTHAKLIKTWSTVSLLSFGISAFTGGLVHHYYPHTGAYPNTPTGWHVFWAGGFYLKFCS